MKKFSQVFKGIGVTLGVICLSTSVFGMDIYVNNVQIPVNTGASSTTESGYVLDVEPELKDGRVYIPLSYF